MKAEHDSRNAAFRWPLGACEAGGRVRLSVRVEGAEKASGELRIWQDGAGELRLPLKGETEGRRFSADRQLTSLAAAEPSLKRSCRRFRLPYTTKARIHRRGSERA